MTAGFVSDVDDSQAIRREIEDLEAAIASLTPEPSESTELFDPIKAYNRATKGVV